MKTKEWGYELEGVRQSAPTALLLLLPPAQPPHPPPLPQLRPNSVPVHPGPLQHPLSSS